MVRHASLWLIGLMLAAGCGRTPEPVVTLNGVAASAPVRLGDVSAWEETADGLTAQLSLVSSKASVTCTRDGAAVVCPRSTSGEDRVDLLWPRTKTGAEETLFVVLLDGVEAGRWVVSRTVVDPGLSVCVATTSGEDDGLPLDRCKPLEPFSDLQLPMDKPMRVLFKRARFTIQSGRVEVRRISLVSHQDDELAVTSLGLFRRAAEVTPTLPLLLEVDTESIIAVGTRTLAWGVPPVSGPRLHDLDPNRAPVRVRVGGRAEISRSLQAVDASAELTGFRDDAGVLTLTSSLPARLEVTSPTGLIVALSPKAVGASSFWPRLSLRSSAGEWTDRIPFRVEGLPATDCRLEAADVDVGPVLIGETRVARLQVRNTGTAPCPKLRVRPLAVGLQLESRPIPAPGDVAEWRLTFSPQAVGTQVVLLEADFDDAQPSFADLTVRVEASVTR